MRDRSANKQASGNQCKCSLIESFSLSFRCTVDPYLFQNFETSDEGNSLRAQFKAFKFPESNFVLFKGTVNVCLDKCGGVSNTEFSLNNKLLN